MYWAHGIRIDQIRGTDLNIDEVLRGTVELESDFKVWFEFISGLDSAFLISPVASRRQSKFFNHLQSK